MRTNILETGLSAKTCAQASSAFRNRPNSETAWSAVCTRSHFQARSSNIPLNTPIRREIQISLDQPIAVNMLRSKLLMSFMLCLALPAGLSAILIGYQNERARLNGESHQLEAGHLHLTQSFQTMRDFFRFSQREASFYESGESDLLDRTTSSLAEVRAAVSALEQKDPQLDVAIAETRKLLDAYEAQLIVLVDLLRLRGFENYGIVGEMRGGIHRFDDTDIDSDIRARMLSLRRAEKDYIIRYQNRHVELVRAGATELRTHLQNTTSLDNETRSLLIAGLGKYTNAFEQLVTLNERMGLRNNSGLYAELSSTETELNESYANVQASNASALLAAQQDLTNKLYYAIGLFFLFGLAVSVFLTNALTRRLRILSGKVRKFIRSEFKETVILSPALKSNDEVGLIARDFEVLQEALQQHVSSIREMAYYDMLTGLASRSYLNQRLTEMITSAERSGDGFALFFIDLDAFKDVNDSLGHDAGDQLLVEIGQRLGEAARGNDFVARLGGDEFCMLLDGLQDEGDIAQVAERVINNIEQNVVVHERNFKPQASIGISRYPADGEDSRTLMQAGDNAMYAAKNAGHHRFEFFNREMTQKAAERFTLAQELRNAFKEDQFLLHYQPQVSIQSGEIHAWEALVRWQHPGRGMVPPGEFVPEIERLGLIKDLGDWAIKEATRQIVRWQKDGMTRVRVSVNIAPRHFDDPKLIHTVRTALDESGLAPWQLELEVTETGIQSSPKARGVLEELRKMGVPVAIDDFGTGYSSLGSLKHLPIDCLKIDRTFIDTVGSTQDEILLGTIMSLGHALNFRIVAEGVEELEQLQVLQGMDCDLVQGYYFSRPIAAAEVPEMARSGFREKARQLKTATSVAAAGR